MKSEKGTWRSHVPFSLFGGRGGDWSPTKRKGGVGGDRGGRRVFALRANSDVGGTLPPHKTRMWYSEDVALSGDIDDLSSGFGRIVGMEGLVALEGGGFDGVEFVVEHVPGADEIVERGGGVDVGVDEAGVVEGEVKELVLEDEQACEFWGDGAFFGWSGHV